MLAPKHRTETATVAADATIVVDRTEDPGIRSIIVIATAPEERKARKSKVGVVAKPTCV